MDQPENTRLLFALRALLFVLIVVFAIAGHAVEGRVQPHHAASASSGD